MLGPDIRAFRQIPALLLGSGCCSKGTFDSLLLPVSRPPVSQPALALPVSRPTGAGSLLALSACACAVPRLRSIAHMRFGPYYRCNKCLIASIFVHRARWQLEAVLSKNFRGDRVSQAAQGGKHAAVRQLQAPIRRKSRPSNQNMPIALRPTGLRPGGLLRALAVAGATPTAPAAAPPT